MAQPPQKVNQLNPSTLLELGDWLDRPSRGRDWIALAEKIGRLTPPQLRLIESKRTSISPTVQVLRNWETTREATLANLIRYLYELGREDVAEVLFQKYPNLRNETEIAKVVDVRSKQTFVSELKRSASANFPKLLKKFSNPKIIVLGEKDPSDIGHLFGSLEEEMTTSVQAKLVTYLEDLGPKRREELSKSKNSLELLNVLQSRGLVKKNDVMPLLDLIKNDCDLVSFRMKLEDYQKRAILSKQ